MKRIITLAAVTLMFVLPAFAQDDAQKAAAEAAAEMTTAPDTPVVPPKPKYWDLSLKNMLTFGQTFLSQWAAGGYNNYTLVANIDGIANYAKDKVTWQNRLMMDYGFLYQADKPILQKTTDRFYFLSTWGYSTPVKHLNWSATFDFTTQFNNNWAYGTPKSDGETEPTHKDWLNARTLKSGLFSPAYINLGFGIKWTPKPWLSVDFSPFTGGVVTVMDETLRAKYGMKLRSQYVDETGAPLPEYAGAILPSYYRGVRYEFGARIIIDANWVINKTFTYGTTFKAFYNYLSPKIEPRITWDNRVSWNLAKYFALVLNTYLIYDPLVIVRDTDNDGKADAKGVQFKEFLQFGFTYSIAGKK